MEEGANIFKAYLRCELDWLEEIKCEIEKGNVEKAEHILEKMIEQTNKSLQD